MNATVETEPCRFRFDMKLRVARQTRQTSASQSPPRSSVRVTRLPDQPTGPGPRTCFREFAPSGLAVPAFPSLTPPARPLWKPDGPRRGPGGCRPPAPGSASAPPSGRRLREVGKTRRRLGEGSHRAPAPRSPACGRVGRIGQAHEPGRLENHRIAPIAKCSKTLRNAAPN